MSTDIIVGYPAETDEDFKRSVEIIKKTKPIILNISKFWPSQGTKAAELKKLKAGIIKRRAIELMDLHRQRKKMNKKLIGMKFKCLGNRKGFEDTFLARNSDYKLVAIKGKNLLGKLLEIKIVKALPHYLIGKVLQQ